MFEEKRKPFGYDTRKEVNPPMWKRPEAPVRWAQGYYMEPAQMFSDEIIRKAVARGEEIFFDFCNKAKAGLIDPRNVIDVLDTLVEYHRNFHGFYEHLNQDQRETLRSLARICPPLMRKILVKYPRAFGEVTPSGLVFPNSSESPISSR